MLWHKNYEKIIRARTLVVTLGILWIFRSRRIQNFRFTKKLVFPILIHKRYAGIP